MQLNTRAARHTYGTGVCEKNTPPEKKALGKISVQSTKSGAGEQLFSLGCRAEARAKGVFLQTPVRDTTNSNSNSNRTSNSKTNSSSNIHININRNKHRI